MYLLKSNCTLATKHFQTLNLNWTQLIQPRFREDQCIYETQSFLIVSPIKLSIHKRFLSAFFIAFFHETFLSFALVWCIFIYIYMRRHIQLLYIIAGLYCGYPFIIAYPLSSYIICSRFFAGRIKLSEILVLVRSKISVTFNCWRVISFVQTRLLNRVSSSYKTELTRAYLL